MKLSRLFPLFAALSLLCQPAQAQQTEPVADPHITAGPSEIKLRDQATLKLPADYLFIDQQRGSELMRKMGNPTDSRFLGLVVPKDEKAQWMVVAEYEASGYIKDDDAKDWNADELLTSLKEGTEAANQARREANIAELEVTGWAEKPHYQADSHQLVWAALSRDKGAPASDGQGINYNTYALGREGYISLNLVTDAATIEADKPAARTLLAALSFNDGKRYQDFDASTDRVAEYGLSALVAGVAAKKLGLFAVIAAFFAKFFKFIAIGGIALLAGLKRLFGKKSAS
ncbi:DUF2167 domain-containing protein [Chitinimonas lacunae]|uniref:DUF2167 domain-containing protein n=1 Tax=Chitinimonas lacunae TaxID=1963018 RepID=A0ABV8MP68_9NEIS